MLSNNSATYRTRLAYSERLAQYESTTPGFVHEVLKVMPDM